MADGTHGDANGQPFVVYLATSVVEIADVVTDTHRYSEHACD